MRTVFQLGMFAAMCLSLARASIFVAAGATMEPCVNVVAEGSVPLVNVSGSVGTAPIAATFGSIRGKLSSIVTFSGASAAAAETPRSVTLTHTFASADPARVGTFTMKGRAVCEQSSNGAAVCRADQLLEIFAGTGVFAQATGSLRDVGAIDFTAFHFTFSIRGRLCGDRLK
jgi:hypothetical protein